MQKIKWGIIGTGKISTKFATALNSLDCAELSAIASRDKKNAERFAEQFQIKKAYGSYEELAMDTDIDVIYIGTPHTEHKSNAELCIRNHKAVLCEKPFTVNHGETEYLIALAKEYNVFLMEAMWTKFLPATQRVKQWLNSGAIGKLRYINISFGFQTEFDPKSRLFDPMLAGGALLDVGVYPISLVLFLLDKLPDEIVAGACIGKSDVDEIDVIAMKYKDGIMANISCAISANTGNDAIFLGDKGKIVVPNFWTAESAELYDAQGKLIDTFLRPFTSNGYVYEAEEVSKCIAEGKTQSDVIPLKDTLDNMKITDRIRQDIGLIYPFERTDRN